MLQSKIDLCRVATNPDNNANERGGKMVGAYELGKAMADNGIVENDDYAISPATWEQHKVKGVVADFMMYSLYEVDFIADAWHEHIISAEDAAEKTGIDCGPDLSLSVDDLLQKYLMPLFIDVIEVAAAIAHDLYHEENK